MRKILYSLIVFVFFSLNGVNAMIIDKPIDDGIIGDQNTADIAVQKIIGNATKFLYLVAVIYALWGGFQMLTAGGKEEQMKKGRTIIIQALIGLIVIWLANSIVAFVVNSILGGGSGA